MPEPSRIDQLDRAIDALLANAAGAPEAPELAPLLAIARELRNLPRENFKQRLQSELERSESMSTQAQPAPAPQSVTPRLRLKNAAAAIEFYKRAFGAREVMRFEAGGGIPHAELAIGNSLIHVGDEAPEYGYPGPETLGGSPIALNLRVDDVDAFIEKAVAAGARPVLPITDQFYGDRSGSVADPFGYTWSVATRKENLTLEEMQARLAAMQQGRVEAEKAGVSPVPKGYRTVTPYLVVQDAAALIDFVKQTFGAEETFRTIGSGGGIHAEVRLGDSMLMIGGGGPGLGWRGEAMPTALHVYVEDVDAVHRRGVAAGATVIQAPADQPYGERGGSLRDPAGNHWYIATAKGSSYIPEGLHSVNVYLHPRRAQRVIDFLKRGFGAEEMEKYASPDGVIQHARVRLGDSMVEMGEAEGPYQPMPTMFYLYVPDVDALYSRALNAGATSISPPADQSYGDRTAGVKDVFGNQWYIAMHFKDVAP